MNFDQLIQSAVQDTVGPSLWAFRPELALSATIVAVLLARTIAPRWTAGAFYLTLTGICTAIYFGFSWYWRSESIPEAGPIFTGTLLSDSFTVVLRSLLLLFAVLFTTFTQIANAGREKRDRGKGDRFALPERPDGCFAQSEPVPLSPARFALPERPSGCFAQSEPVPLSPGTSQDDMTEFYVLMLGALVGMCLMLSANHILIVVLGVEMASVPCYVLAGMQRNRAASSEAALKYAVFGAGTAGVMLYGLSLLAGVLGSAHLPTMSARLVELIQSGAAADRTMVLVLGGLMLMVGVAFKLSAVPFHFWAPDVFEGATAEVAAFLSVASKAAALGLLVRLAAGFAFPTGLALHADPAAISALAPVRLYICTLLSLLAAVTCTFGNLAAYGQTNMKRLLAYSTIAHAGYMMMPVAAAVALVGTNLDEARSAVAALVVYIGIYLFMNLAAFAIVAFLRNALQSEEIADYAGLVHTSPGLTVCMAIVMFSLVGLPPLAGFQGKLVVFGALVQAKLWTLLFVGILNTVLSLFYYLRVVRVMVFAPEPLYRAPPRIPLSSMVGSYCALLTVPVVALFFLLGGLLKWADAAASALFY